MISESAPSIILDDPQSQYNVLANRLNHSRGPEPASATQELRSRIKIGGNGVKAYGEGTPPPQDRDQIPQPSRSVENFLLRQKDIAAKVRR
jgi:hypothetical protein